MAERTTVWMETQSGARFNPLDPHPEYSLKDLIWGVARDCRYSGQLRPDVEMYSVAEHLWLLTRYVQRHYPGTFSARELRTLAMHDAQEGVVGDMTRPMKKAVPEFVVVEDRFARSMSDRYDLIFPLPRWVKDLDNRIIVDERRQAMNPSGNRWASDDLQPLGVELNFWLPSQAAREYSLLLRELGVGDGTV